MSQSARLQAAFRLAALLGCAVGELPARVGYDEWIEWLAWWELEPWGEPRADLRQSVGIAYQLAPYLPAGRELPRLIWPYYDEAEEIDDATMQAAAEAERRRWADWEVSRKRKVIDGEINQHDRD